MDSEKKRLLRNIQNPRRDETSYLSWFYVVKIVPFPLNKQIRIENDYGRDKQYM